jgi:hypothetical protein
MFAVIASNTITASHTIDPPDTNWIAVGDAQSTGTVSETAHVYVFKKKVLSSEAGTNGPTNYTWSILEGNARSWNISILACDGLDTTDSVEEIAFDGEGGVVDTTIPCPSVTTDGANRIVVRIGAIREASTTFATLSGYNERVDVVNASGTLFAVTWQDVVQASEGATGAVTLQAGAVGPSGEHMGATLVLIQGGPPPEALRPNAALVVTNFVETDHTRIDADPDTTPVTDAGLTPVVDP